MSYTLRQAYNLIKTNHLGEAEAILRDYPMGAPDSAEAFRDLGRGRLGYWLKEGCSPLIHHGKQCCC